MYSPACDIFSMGCIFHLLLTGFPVFRGSKCEEVYLHNKMLQLQIEVQAVQDFNPHAMELLQGMLQVSPHNRLSAGEAIRSPFFGDRHERAAKKETDEETMTDESNSPRSINEWTKLRIVM
jgi:serine/threonine protein kinase